MKKFNEICGMIADVIVYTIIVAAIAGCLYIGYRYDVNTVKQGIKEVQQEQK